MLNTPGAVGANDIPWRISSSGNYNEIQPPRKPELSPPQNKDRRFYPEKESTWDDWNALKLVAKLDIVNDLCLKSDEMEMQDTQETVNRVNTQYSDEKQLERKQDYEVGKWGTALLTFSCIAAMTAVITGITLIATGVGVIAGCLILAGGLIQIGSLIMEVTGGWTKVKALLPGDDEDKKGAILSWIQIAITIFCLIIAGAGAVIGGISTTGTSMARASALMGAIAHIGYGISKIGQGAAQKDLFKNRANLKKLEAQLANLHYHRKDLMENIEERVEDGGKFYDIVHSISDSNHDFLKVTWGR